MGTPSWQGIHNTRYEAAGHVSYVEAKKCIGHPLRHYFNRKQKC